MLKSVVKAILVGLLLGIALGAFLTSFLFLCGVELKYVISFGVLVFLIGFSIGTGGYSLRSLEDAVGRYGNSVIREAGRIRKNRTGD